MKDEDKVTDELRKELVELREQIAKLTKANTSLEKQISEYKKREEQLTYLATHDPVTGLPNRVLFNEHLTVALHRAHRNLQELTIMWLDLDYFKNVNDTLGHRVGDKLLRAVGNRLRNLLRKSDTVSRMGGDEFLLLLPEIAETDGVCLVAQKILETFQKPFVLGNHEIDITTSVGIAIYPADGEDVDNLLRSADIALYQAKTKGRNNYQHFTPSMSLQDWH